jgi:hypothetical protein
MARSRGVLEMMRNAGDASIVRATLELARG